MKKRKGILSLIAIVALMALLGVTTTIGLGKGHS